MKKFLVIGVGRFGRGIALELDKENYEVSVMDIDKKAIEDMKEYNIYDAKVEDATIEEKLENVTDYHCVVVAIASEMESSILITAMLKNKGVERVVCKAKNELHKHILEQLGADEVIIPEYQAGQKFAHHLINPDIIDFINLSKEYGILEIKTPNKWIGKKIEDINKYNTSITIIYEEGKKPIEHPKKDTILEKCQSLIILGLKKDLNRIQKLMK